MAAGFMRQLSGERVEVFSGGSEPAGSINPVAVVAMAEKGVDISDQQPEPWTDERLRTAEVVVTMGCGDTCPVIPGNRYLSRRPRRQPAMTGCGGSQHSGHWPVARP